MLFERQEQSLQHQLMASIFRNNGPVSASGQAKVRHNKEQRHKGEQRNGAGHGIQYLLKIMICIHFRIFQLDPDSRKLSRLAAAISTVWPVIYNLDFVGLTCIHCYTVSWCHMTHIPYYSNMHLIPFPRVWIKYSTLGKSNIFLRLAW